jgi:hypothetical protein
VCERDRSGWIEEKRGRDIKERILDKIQRERETEKHIKKESEWVGKERERERERDRARERDRGQIENRGREGSLRDK